MAYGRILAHGCLSLWFCRCLHSRTGTEGASDTAPDMNPWTWQLCPCSTRLRLHVSKDAPHPEPLLTLGIMRRALGPQLGSGGSPSPASGWTHTSALPWLLHPLILHRRCVWHSEPRQESRLSNHTENSKS